MINNFTSVLLRHAEEIPDHPAVHFLEAGAPDLPISYAALSEQATGFALKLAEAGIQPGEVVVLIIDYRPQLLFAFWGAVLGGAVPAILPFLTEKLSPERYLADLTSLIKITKPAAIITYGDFQDIVYQAAHPDTSVRSILFLEDIQTDPGDVPEQFPGVGCSPEDIVLLQHSSGTTGLQKGVALSHQAVFNQLEALSGSISLDPQKDVVVSWLPLYHDMGLIAGFILPILTGIPLVLMSPFDWVRAPHKLLQAVTSYGGTLSWLPNFAFNFCTRKIRDRHLSDVDLSSWRAVINCSEPVRWESHQAFFDKFKEYGLAKSALQTSYAMAENTFGVTQSPLDREPTIQRVDLEKFQQQNLIEPAADGKTALTMMSSGIPLSNTEIRVQDPSGNVIPDQQIGEIALRSNCMLTKYYQRPEITQKSFQEGWFLTGDYGYLSNGEIFVTGRKKDLIIVGGKNIYPGDLEELLNEVPGVHPGRTVIFGIYNPTLGTEDVVAVAETDETDLRLKQELADRIRAHINQNSPVALRYIEIKEPMWIIKTSSGKVSRSANKQKYLQEKG